MLEPTQVRRSRAGETSSPWGMQPLISLTERLSMPSIEAFLLSSPRALAPMSELSFFCAGEESQEMLNGFRFGVQQPGEVGEFEMVRLRDFRRAVAAERLEIRAPRINSSIGRDLLD